MNRAWLRTIVSATLISAGIAAVADSIDSRTEAEVAHLLAHLGSSGCEFYRNGAWYPAHAAKAHLERKRDYLAKRALIGSAEDFIDRAATGSSVSGEAYLVRCAQAEPVPTGIWLHRELDRFRAEPSGLSQ